METAALPTAKLTNSINTIGMRAFNNNGTITRTDILSSYSKETLSLIWTTFATFVAKNYQSGKGTSIKSFGTFTFTNVEYSLEGTTNQYYRDIKLRRPVFIVSDSFVEGLRPGQYTKNGGLIYYTQKPNNNISIVKMNLAELASGTSIPKEEFSNAFNHIIKDMGDLIRKREFKNRELPGIGIFMTRANVFGVKFINDFSNDVKKIPQKLIFTKKNIGLFMETSKTNAPFDDLSNADKAINEIRPKTSVITRITQSGEEWLKEKMDINLKKDVIDAKDANLSRSIENFNHSDRFNGKTFFQFKNVKNVLRAGGKLKDLNLPIGMLEALLGCKGQIIKEMKVYDRRNNGIIARFELIRAMSKANIHPNMSMQTLNDIVTLYANGLDYIDYFKLITCLIKDIKLILRQGKNESDDESKDLFNNNFKLGPGRDRERRSMSTSCSFSFGTKSTIDTSIYDSLKVNVDEVENEIKSIKIIFKNIMTRPDTQINRNELSFIPPYDKNITCIDLNNILHNFSITYTMEKMLKILKYLTIDNPNKFSINTLYSKLNQCKITSYEMTNEDINSKFDIVYNMIKRNGGKNLLFKNGNSISLNDFISIMKPISNYTSNVLTILFSKLTNKTNVFTTNDYELLFTENKPKLTQKFFEDSTTRIKNYVKKKKISINKYFNHLLDYNYIRGRNVIEKEHFLLAMQQEDYSPRFTEDELNFIFEKMDTNKDGVVDRNEFKSAISKEQDPLIKMQDIIKQKCFDIEDLAYRLEVTQDKEEFLSFYEFKNKMKRLDYSYTNEFIEGLFIDLCGDLNSKLSSKRMLDNFNVYKKEHFRNTNNVTFKNNFIRNIQQQVDFHTIKAAFEKEDLKFSGKVTKEVFCKIINTFTQEFKDEDIMKFVRITKLTDHITYEVIYQDFLNLIYYNETLDNFLLCIDEVKKLLIANKGDLQKVISQINCSSNYYTDIKYIPVDSLFTYLSKALPNAKFEKKTVSKFDLDSDGKISYEDLKAILSRYISTSFFKYENSDKETDVNLYASEKLNDSEFKAIVREIKTAIKKKNVTEIGLFKKLDENKDGFISNAEFNKNIESVVPLAPAIKDKIFDYLDYYHNGLVDLETFLLRFKEFKSNEIIIKNDNRIENVIVNQFAAWITKMNDKLCDTEIFSIIDRDSDGLISLEDFKFFVIDSLGISKNEFNDYKLERVMQRISLTKNKNIGLGDIREFISRAIAKNEKSYYVDLKETFKETTNQNLYRGKKNTMWISQAIERFGMFISERFDGVEKFYEKYCDNSTGKFKYENFDNFHKTNYECFYGFNLTRDELLAIYTSLDSQKKNYLTLDDFKNKLNLFDFYKKMHFDIKKFLNTNFPSNIDAFKFFITPNINNVISTNSQPFPSSITKKEFFDGLNYLFPRKYATQTLLNYYNTNFGAVYNAESISFSQFSFVYYDMVTPNEESQMRRTYNKLTKISTSRSQQFSQARSGSALPSHPFETLPHPKLKTPFDIDPLEKLKRIIDSSSRDYLGYIRMQIMLSGNGIVNEFVFRNMIKDLNLGLTSIEIEDIIKRCGKTRDGKMNLNEFYKFISSNDKSLNKAHHNISTTLSEIKQLLYKYYSNPKLAFEYSDNRKLNQMDFDKFKSIVGEMYKREDRQMPNFALLKNTFDYIDLRKDGYIDMNEWTNSFGRNVGKLDVILNNRQEKALRQWETSDGIIGIYKAIAKNKKMIWEKVKAMSFGRVQTAMIQEDNLIAVLKDIFPTWRLTNTQWKMIVEIADKDSSNLIQFDLFIKIVEHCANKAKSQPRFK